MVDIITVWCVTLSLFCHHIQQFCIAIRACMITFVWFDNYFPVVYVFAEPAARIIAT